MLQTRKILAGVAICCVAQTLSYALDSNAPQEDNTESYKLNAVTTTSKLKGYETSTKTFITADDLEKT